MKGSGKHQNPTLTKWFQEWESKTVIIQAYESQGALLLGKNYTGASYAQLLVHIWTRCLLIQQYLVNKIQIYNKSFKLKKVAIQLYKYQWKQLQEYYFT